MVWLAERAQNSEKINQKLILVLVLMAEKIMNKVRLMTKNMFFNNEKENTTKMQQTPFLQKK